MTLESILLHGSRNNRLSLYVCSITKLMSMSVFSYFVLNDKINRVLLRRNLFFKNFRPSIFIFIRQCLCQGFWKGASNYGGCFEFLKLHFPRYLSRLSDIYHFAFHFLHQTLDWLFSWFRSRKKFLASIFFFFSKMLCK